MRVLLLALVLGACAAPDPAATAEPGVADTPDAEPISEPGFNAEAWMEAVEAATNDPDRVVLSAQLLDAVDWRTACGEDDPTAEGRGVVRLLHLSPTESLAEITCQRFDRQSTFALVDARAGRPPRLIRALGVLEDGTLSADTTASFFGVVSHDPATAPSRFDVLTTSAGHGGCGTDTHYRLLAGGGAAVEQIRAHDDCDEPLAPEDWPVVYPDE
ncbi:hypothetical protein [Rubrivirga sp.]|uniref:hypothetical protein n=1 Tax=Rubrivirga sp. TaxID=1885344 RepID=UPI003B51F9E8